MDSRLWRVGDLVSRHGPDEQRIVSIDHGWGTLRVIVVKSCGRDCCPLNGEWEDNLIRRYGWVCHGSLKSRPVPLRLPSGTV